MQSNLLFLKSTQKTSPLSVSQIELRIHAFETTYKTSLIPNHRHRFLNGCFGSIQELETKLKAYRVFGDLGYGDRCFTSSR